MLTWFLLSKIAGFFGKNANVDRQENRASRVKIGSELETTSSLSQKRFLKLEVQYFSTFQ
jgi:hypothetical protein